MLNLGHTFAHAYESTLDFSKKLNHGEAVILGIKSAAEFSYQNKFLPKYKLEMILKHINKIGLIPKIRKFFKKKDVKKILNYMKNDKKNNSSNINLILINDFGKINIQVYYPSGNKIEFSKPNLKFKIMNFFKMQKYFWNKKRKKDLREKFLDNI